MRAYVIYVLLCVHIVHLFCLTCINLDADLTHYHPLRGVCYRLVAGSNYILNTYNNSRAKNIYAPLIDVCLNL